MRKESDANGRLTAHAEYTFLQTVDFCPPIKVEKADTERVFELRTYKCTTNNLPNLLARFRDHTVGLFAKHSLTQLGYWTPAPETAGSLISWNLDTTTDSTACSGLRPGSRGAGQLNLDRYRSGRPQKTISPHFSAAAPSRV